jgi:hypothetical protein
MFGLGKPECPVEPEDQEWIEARLEWLAETLGRERLVSGPVVTPTREFFPFDMDGTEDSGRRMFEHVCGIMGVDPEPLVLKYYEGDQPITGGAVEYEWSSDGAAGTYEKREQVVISINDELLKHAESFVATVAHELGHVVLLGDGILTGDEEDHEELTDLVTVYYGLGIFSANGSLREYQADGLMSYSWGWSRLGYLDFPLWGYAHAVYAWMRGEPKPAWARHLRPDVRAHFNQGMKYIRSNNKRKS